MLREREKDIRITNLHTCTWGGACDGADGAPHRPEHAIGHVARRLLGLMGGPLLPGWQDAASYSSVRGWSKFQQQMRHTMQVGQGHWEYLLTAREKGKPQRVHACSLKNKRVSNLVRKIRIRRTVLVHVDGVRPGGLHLRIWIDLARS